MRTVRGLSLCLTATVLALAHGARAQPEVSESPAAFDLLGSQGRVRVVCPGPIPDNLAEDMDVVVEGVLESPGSLRGTSVLTRCSSKYQPEAG